MTTPTTSPPVPKADLRARFDQLVAHWKAESLYLSNSARMARLESYQEIIAFGAAAVPLILAELQRQPDHWFKALETITGEDPVPSEARGKVGEMADAWIAWGKQQGYLAT